MRIAIFHDLPSGGAKRTLAEATRRLALRHHLDVYALSVAEHEFGDVRPFVANHRVTEFAPAPLLKSPFGRLNQALRYVDLRRLDAIAARAAHAIDSGGYDVAFVHPCQFEQAPSVLSHLRRTPAVYFCQEPRRVLYETMPERPYDGRASRRRQLLDRLDPLPALYQAAIRHVDRRNTRSASTVLVNSRFMAQTVARIYGVSPHVSYLGVDVAQFEPAVDARGDYVLSVGSLTPLKGFDFLIDAMSKYPAATRPPLVIASNFQNPPERAYLERLAGERGVSLVLRGNVTDRDLVALYAHARAIVYAPIREPFGLVPLEAMACATPVVTVAEGGTSESVVDRETGFLVERNAARFADAVRQVVEDPVRARALGERGRAHVLANWTWERAVATLETYLEGTAAGRPVQLPVPAMA